MVVVELWLLLKKSFLIRGKGFFLFFLVQVSQCNIFIWALLATELQYLTFGSFCIHDMCVYGARAWLQRHWCLCLLKSTLVISYVYSLVGGSAIVLLVRYSTDTMNVHTFAGKVTQVKTCRYPPHKSSAPHKDEIFVQKSVTSVHEIH